MLFLMFHLLHNAGMSAVSALHVHVAKVKLLPRAAYARAGLSNRFCPSVVVCHTNFWKTLPMGNSDVTRISKLENNAHVRGKLVYMYLIK